MIGNVEHIHTEHTNNKLTVNIPDPFSDYTCQSSLPQNNQCVVPSRWTSKLNSEFEGGDKSTVQNPSWYMLAPAPKERQRKPTLRKCGPCTATSSQDHSMGREAKSNLKVEKPDGLDLSEVIEVSINTHTSRGQRGPSRGWDESGTSVILLSWTTIPVEPWEKYSNRGASYHIPDRYSSNRHQNQGKSEQRSQPRCA